MRAIWLRTTRSRGYLLPTRSSDANAAGVVTVGLLDHGLEEMNTAERVVAGRCLGDERLRRVGLSFLDERARDVQPAVRVLGLGFGHLLERELRALEVALQQQADAPVVPALAARLVHDRPPVGAAPSPTAICAVASASVTMGRSGMRSLICPDTLAGMLAGSNEKPRLSKPADERRSCPGLAARRTRTACSMRELAVLAASR